MTRNEKGLTLVEVLGSVVLLGIAVLGIIFIIQQSSVHTKANADTDESVVLSRNVMEQLKQQLPGPSDTLTLYQQNLSLADLRELSGTTIYYPGANNARYAIAIQSEAAALGTADAGGTTVNLDDQFRRITIRTTYLATSRTYELTGVVAYK
ncbi:type IV pilus modification PilV family protein [Paenibacillus sp. strain BS8-2]